MTNLVYNAALTPDGTLLESFSIHDFVQHTDNITGELYFVDGGLAYQRRSINKVPMTDISVFDNEDHDIIREVFRWGTYGKHGNKPFRRVALKNMTDDHIQAVLDTQFHIPSFIRALFVKEQKYRIAENITIKDQND